MLFTSHEALNLAFEAPVDDLPIGTEWLKCSLLKASPEGQLASPSGDNEAACQGLVSPPGKVLSTL